MQDISLFLLEDFPDNLILLGESKFKTPRCCDNKIPIIVLPECCTTGVSTFRDKNYLHLEFSINEKYKFDKVFSWIKCISSKPLHPFITESEDKIEMKVKLPIRVSVINIDGSETNTYLSSNASVIRCAVQIACLWENDSNVGISLQVVQCKIMNNKQCMIQPMDEYPDYVPFHGTIS